MNGKFFDLSKEKQDRMINGALKVFATGGYKHASTDDIVKEAGISKGLLFHYFESKIGVYAFVYDYSVRYMALEMGSLLSGEAKDVFTMRKGMEAARSRALKGYPYMQLFLNRAMSENVSEALVATEEMRGRYEEMNAQLAEKTSFSLLPAGVDVEKFNKLLDYAYAGLLAERFETGTFQAEQFYEEVCDYLDMMKKMC